MIAIALIFGGGFYNLGERIISGGCVRDYFCFFNMFHFNIADIAVSIGILTLILRIVITEVLPGKFE
jgi:lipoprotein signal peptidase